jgi:hypothetical protein
LTRRADYLVKFPTGGTQLRGVPETTDKKIRSRVPSAQRDDKLFQKACPELERDRIFDGAHKPKKSDPSILRDKLFEKIGFLSWCQKKIEGSSRKN